MVWFFLAGGYSESESETVFFFFFFFFFFIRTHSNYSILNKAHNVLHEWEVDYCLLINKTKCQVFSNVR
jgi:hypothetical protein